MNGLELAERMATSAIHRITSNGADMVKVFGAEECDKMLSDSRELLLKIKEIRDGFQKTNATKTTIFTAEWLSNLHSQLTGEARSLMEKKNQDYSASDDCFGNILACEKTKLCDSRIGVLVRMQDKLARLANSGRNTAQFKDESIRDTVLDVINYAVFLAALQERAMGK